MVKRTAWSVSWTNQFGSKRASRSTTKAGAEELKRTLERSPKQHKNVKIRKVRIK
jgi:hypothetical protein